jgi:FkbM family methyltransferase
MYSLHRLIRLARTPGAARALLSWRPFSATSLGLMVALKRRGVEYRTILDGGANVGQFARAAVETYPDATVLSFEPNPVAAGRFRRNLGTHPRVRLLETALGDRDGTITFYPNTYSQASTCLETAAAVGRTLAPITVPIGRLDSVLAVTPLQPPVLLKLDLQGYEQTALLGAMRTLRQCAHVLVEVEFTGDGPAAFEAVWRRLEASGFTFSRPLDVLTGPDGRCYQMDALFESTVSPTSLTITRGDMIPWMNIGQNGVSA